MLAEPTRSRPSARSQIRDRSRLILTAALALGGIACGGGSDTSPPPPPPPITVSVAPPAATPFLGATQQFTATVANTTNTGVNWSVNGIAGGNAMVGTISPAGLYTAPQALPMPASVTVTATSQADPTKSSSANVTVMSDVSVSVMPGMANVELGAALQFTGTVAGNGNPLRTVSWSVNGIAGGNLQVGTISASGLYTAPAILPSPASVAITATSQADPSKSATVNATITSNFTLAVNGPAAVNNGAMAQYNAVVLPLPGSNPSPSVNWSISGMGCAVMPSACGTIDGTGLYTAPLLAPSPATVTITATSVADPTKSASINVTINSLIAVTVAPSPASVALEAAQSFTATVAGTANTAVTWDVNGIVGGNTSVGTVNNPAVGPTSPSNYNAPVNMPAGGMVTVRATSQADPTKSDSAVVTLFSTLSVNVTPNFSTRAVNRIQTFAVQVPNTSNPNVDWRVNGVPGGDLINGQICVAGFTPCTPIVAPTTAMTVDYLAPAAVPSPSTVTISATSQADPQKVATILVNIISNVQVSVAPASVTLPVNGMQQYGATVLGSPDQSVAWSLSGPSCAGAACGSITAGGLYTAPAVAPAPNNTVTVTATSTDGMQAASGVVTIATGAFIQRLLPASVTAAPATGFLFKVLGANFVAGSGGTGSTILFEGNALTTTCQTGGSECTAVLSAGALSTAGNKTVQLRNPDMSTSNQVEMVVIPMPTTEDRIAVTDATPITGKDIVVVEPTTAGSGAGATPGTPLNIGGIGILTGPACNAIGGPIALQRPAAGQTSRDICLSGDGLTDTHLYTISGPSPNDIAISNVQPLGLGFVRMTLTFSSGTQPGPRTLFVESANRDKAAANGAIEIK